MGMGMGMGTGHGHGARLSSVNLDTGQAPALRSAGRRIAAGLVAAPIVDVADDRGLLGGVLRLDLDLLGGVGIAPYLWLVFFAAVGAGFAHQFFGHRPRASGVFVIAASIPVGAYWIMGGFRLSIVLAVLLLALGLVSWSIAGFDAEPAP